MYEPSETRYETMPYTGAAKAVCGCRRCLWDCGRTLA